MDMFFEALLRMPLHEILNEKKARRKRGFFSDISRTLKSYGIYKTNKQCKSHFQKKHEYYIAKAKELMKNPS